MEAATQSALFMIWALFWMLALSLMMVHPTFRTTRVQIRRSLHLHLNRWRTARHWLRGRMLGVRGHFRIRLGKSLLWLARRLEQSAPLPLWLRFLLNLKYHVIFMYLFWHVLCRQPMTSTFVLGYLAAVWTIDSVKAWRKRRKQRLQQTDQGGGSTIKPAQEESAKQ